MRIAKPLQFRLASIDQLGVGILFIHRRTITEGAINDHRKQVNFAYVLS